MLLLLTLAKYCCHMSKKATLFEPQPVLMTPIWSGTKLIPFKQDKKQPCCKIGESWEISFIEGKSSFPPDFEEKTPYLVKFIDTQYFLSIQVHPNTEQARAHGKMSGKEECWLILEAEEGSGIYLGSKKGVSQQEFKKRLKNRGDITELLNFIPVKRGDFFFIPAGTVHAIGPKITLLEVQQSADITYRVFDYNRKDDSGNLRELHIQEAMDCINFSDAHLKRVLSAAQKEVFSTNQKLISHHDFDVSILEISGTRHLTLQDNKRAHSLVVLEGKLQIEDRELTQYQSILLSQTLLGVELLGNAIVALIE